MRLSQKLQKWSLPLKITLLALAAITIFIANFLLIVMPLHIYFLLFSGFTLMVLWLGYVVLEKHTFRYVFTMWGIGCVVYLTIAIPRIYLGGMLTPYFVFTNIFDRWLYTLLLPQLILATLILGLTFVQVTSPVEFLRWRRIGPKIALLFRVLQHAEQAFYETKMALIMQGKWSDDSRKLISVRETWLKVRYAPLLIATTLRNIILHWLPWGWLCFKATSKLSYVLIIILAGAVAALTLLGRIPIPATGGYLNLGDIGVIFCGLFLRGFGGALAGGIGSALADLVGGFFIFAPITFVAKGLEALLATKLADKSPWFLIFAALVMVLIYFIAETFLPGMGLSAAISSLPFNFIQGMLGASGGWLVYKFVSKALPQ